MKKPQAAASILLASTLAFSALPCLPTTAFAQTSFEHSSFIETEQPELTPETKELISKYQRNPTQENYLNLRAIVIANYDDVLARKEEKLASLKAETAGKPGGDEIVAEMEDIVQDMYATYWNRINSSMLRFTDSRLLQWKTSNAANYDFIPVMGAGESVYVSRTPVTNEQYAQYLQATGAKAPENWLDGSYPEGEADLPVNYVSYADAQAYCAWLTQQDGINTYRLPNESEWELAAGHMPKDADFNCGISDGRMSVTQFEGITRGAHGALDFWGNVWEWTSTARNDESTLGVKGGAWNSERTDCRTENRKEGRDATQGYEDVGFRVLQILNGEEPEQKVELATLEAPLVSIDHVTDTSITLSWEPVKGATEYQLFEYFEDTGLIDMLGTTTDTSATMDNLETNSTHSYIVQPISYVEIADNVSAEHKITATCGKDVGGSEAGETTGGEGSGESTGETTTGKYENIDLEYGSLKLINAGGLNCWLYAPGPIESDTVPLVVYLHGVTGKSDDPNDVLTADGLGKYLSSGELGNIEAYVLLPQLPADAKDWVSCNDNVVDAVSFVCENYPIDADNISLTGFSMGGTGTWAIGAKNTNLFSRIAPCAGSVRGKKEMRDALRNTPIWSFVGENDDVVKPDSSIDFINKLSRVNSNAHIIVLPEADHVSVAELAYQENGSDLLSWLIGK